MTASDAEPKKPGLLERVIKILRSPLPGTSTAEKRKQEEQKRREYEERQQQPTVTSDEPFPGIDRLSLSELLERQRREREEQTQRHLGERKELDDRHERERGETRGRVRS